MARMLLDAGLATEVDALWANARWALLVMMLVPDAANDIKRLLQTRDSNDDPVIAMRFARSVMDSLSRVKGMGVVFQ